MRRKHTETIKNDMFVYCNLRNCPHVECRRHNINAPFNVLILMERFTPDKDWNCRDMEV